MKGTTAYILAGENTKTQIAMASLGIASITTSGLDIIITYNAGNTAQITVPTPPKGDKGDPGVSISNVEIDDDHNLKCTLSDGTEINAGVIEASEGTKDYEELINLPKINGVELKGDLSAEDLNINNTSDGLQKAIVCIIDDDGTTRSNDTYTGMTTWLNDQNIPMDFAICYDTIGTSGKYTVSQLQDLQAKGNGILIHGNTRLQDFTTVDEVREELEKAIKFHTDNGLEPTNIYVYPEGLNGDYTLTAEEVKAITAEYFDYGLNVNIAGMSSEETKGIWNKIPLEDKLNIARMEIKDTKDLASYQDSIDKCIESKGLLILFTHSFRSTFLTDGYVNFQEVINYLLTQNVDFMTVNDALEKIEKLNINYNDLTNKPKINGIELNGDKTLEELGIKPVDENLIKNKILDEKDYLNMKANDFVKLLGAGWNLGNSLDSWDTSGADKTVEEWETSWNNPLTTKEMIQMVADAGFKTIRIPVTYRVHFESDGKTIKEEWFKRVEEVINYAIDCGMYVITNVHHDTGTQGVLNADLANIDSMKEYLINLWDQIGERFSKYSYRLIFEGFNEMLNPSLSDAWKGDADSYEAVNILNQTFIDTVRKQKGNENRFLICCTYGAQAKDYHLEPFKVPHDIVDNKIIVEIHNYNKTENDIATLFTTLEHYFISKNIPLIIGEFGTKDINLDSSSGLDLSDREIATNSYVSKARNLGVPVVVWDNNNGSYQLLDREDLTWKFPTLVNIIVELSNIYKKVDYRFLDENFNLYDVDNYRGGHYGYTDGIYTPTISSGKSEISTLYYLKPKYKTYSFTTDNTDIRFQVMQLDKSMNFINANTIVNGNLNIEENTHYIGITIYMKDVTYTNEELVDQVKAANVTISGSEKLDYLNYCQNDDINLLDIIKFVNNINSLIKNKQDKTDNSLDTNDKTIQGAINEIFGNSLDNIGFSADYKNIIINRKSGLDPYTIPISDIISHANFTELYDVDKTDIGNGKTIVYDAASGKHKYVDSTGTDELVKMDASSNAKYLTDLLDKQTIVNENSLLKVKKLDGQEVTIEEINYLKGLNMNVMDLINKYVNGGIKNIKTPFNTYADLLAYDKTSLLNDITYIAYVLSDETHENAKTSYLIDNTSATPVYFGFMGDHRDFTTDPIKLDSEVTNKLNPSNIDTDALFKLLVINDTYKTLTTVNEVFGTHGAKALYDELIKAIGEKANQSDFETHTNDTTIHMTQTEKDSYFKKVNIAKTLDSTCTNVQVSGAKVTFDELEKKVDKTSIASSVDSSSTDEQVVGAKLFYDNAIDGKSLKTYTYLSQIGLVVPCTVSDIFLALPDQSIITIDCGSVSSSITDVPQSYGTLTILKHTPGRFRIEYNLSAEGSVSNNITWLGQLKGSDGTGLTWRRVCTTNIEDINKTTITFPNETYYMPVSDGACYYFVKNGKCYVNFRIKVVSPTTVNTDCVINLPKTDTVINQILSSTTAGVKGLQIYQASNTLNIRHGDTNAQYEIFYSYPVSES